MFGDVVLGVHGDGFSYLFSYQTGGIESLCIGGKEWLYRTPTPTFWRASTDNDRGCGFPNRSAMWLGADLFWKTEKVTVEKDGCPVEQFLAPDNNRFGGPVGAEQVTICCIGHTATVPAAEDGDEVYGNRRWRNSCRGFLRGPEGTARASGIWHALCDADSSRWI